MTAQSLTQFRESLKSLPFKELEAKLEMYQDLKCMSTRDQVLLGCYENEIERRFLAWEATEV